MINSIKLTNFRRHQDSTFRFGPGLNALRGSNEKGKSTIFEAIAYAMFGVKAIRTSLADAVTWGCSESTLKVTLNVTLDGVEYTVTRGKSGAECVYTGQIVTGQSEVTNFMAAKLGADPCSATKLMFSAQTDVRGALESGTKATTELIERLANFDQIDNLIELMQEKLTLGNTAGAAATLASAKAEVDLGVTVPEPDEQEFERTCANLEAAVRDCQGLLNVADDDEQAAQSRLDTARSKATRREIMAKDWRTAQEELGVIEGELSRIVLGVAPENPQGQIAALQQRISNAEKANEIAAAYSKVAGFLYPPKGTTYEGTLEGLRTEISDTEDLIARNNRLVAELRADIKLWGGELTHGSCTFCGKDFSGVPEVVERNKALTEKIETTKDRVAKLVCLTSGDTEDLRMMRQIERDTGDVMAAVGHAAAYCRVVPGDLPPYLEWTGPELGEAESIHELRVQIRKISEEVSRHATMTVLKAEKERQCQALEAKVLALKQILQATPEVVLPTQDVSDAKERTACRRADLQGATVTLGRYKREHEHAVEAYQQALTRFEQAKERLAAAVKALADLEFNNALLKRVRAARPVVSDRLWAIVLQAVSSYFGDIRGQRSRVTKGPEGFQVDTHPVTSLSGSTLDALGLAIRVALVRTFIPSTPFLLLDEPNAGMDADRTDNMLGFLSACGYRQCILITHEAVSESVADSVIELEG